MKQKEYIVISAINIFEGGALTVLTECLAELDRTFSSEYRVVALVHKKELFQFKNIEFIEFPKSRNSYLLRCYYEYIKFKVLSKKINPALWFSLHDMTPNVFAKTRAVYCHNPSPFYKSRLKDWKLSPTVALFSVFYKYLYRINIHKNNKVVVQQNWLAKAFTKNYNLDKEQVLVAKPFYELDLPLQIEKEIEYNSPYIFFYPAYPRVFKNHELICEAVKELEGRIDKDFVVYLTIDGSEGAYARMIVEKYSDLKNIIFIGAIDRLEVQGYYEKSDALIFPSKLETWGLPISEYTVYHKPILAADLPYAYETGAQADEIAYFNSENPKELAQQMKKLLEGDTSFLVPGKIQDSPYQQSESWEDLFSILLNIK